MKLLFVDDDEAVRLTLAAVLRHQSFDVTAVASVPEALEQISLERFDVLISDLNVGQPGDGFTVVSAMRRVQPHAATFILTGYPDFESAIQAVRNQVDDYFSKPFQIEHFLDTLSRVRQGRRRADHVIRLRKVSQFLSESIDQICERWIDQVLLDPELAALPLTRSERSDHVPALLRAIVRRLDSGRDELDATAAELARKHGKTRFQQGYTIPQILFESRVLQNVISATIRENIISLDLSSLVDDILQIGETMQGAVEISVRVYQAELPRSLQTSFSMLYRSPYLGVMIADAEGILDANDAFLKMAGHSRDELVNGEIRWRDVTPERFSLIDRTAIEQIREFGACAPYEKEISLPDGTAVPLLMGAVRLSLEPFQYSAYVVDLTEQRRLHEADQKLKEWESRYKLINMLAHELNNPLAAMTFSMHLLRTHSDLSEGALQLIGDASTMLERISGTVRRVLAESGNETSHGAGI